MPQLLTRRSLLAGVAVLLASSSVVACSSSKKSATASPSSSASSSATSSSSVAGSSAAASLPPVTPKTVSTSAIGVTVTGAFGTSPTVKVTATSKPTASEVAVDSKGTGAVVKAGDLVVAHDYGRTWTSATAFQNDFTGAPPDTLPVGTNQISLRGLDSALVGIPVGSRVTIVVPPSEAFAAGATLPTGVTSTDTLVFVFDVIDSYASGASATGAAVSPTDTTLPQVSTSAGKPLITIPKTTAPKKLEVSTILQGTGAPIKAGDEVVSQYVGQIWASGTEFDSSWSRNDPAAFIVGANQLIPGWDKGLVGVKTGSRVLLVIPPADGYGSAGQSSAGIKGTDTLVFVIDILGTYPSTEGSAAAASASASPESPAATAPASSAAAGPVASSS